MIPLLSASSFGPKIANALSDSALEKTEFVSSIREALQQLQKSAFNLVIVDDSLPELTDAKFDLLLKRIGCAAPVFVNFSISGAERIAREATSALQRARQEQGAALRVAQEELRGQLRSELTAMLLQTEQLMKMTPLSTTDQGKLRGVWEIATRMNGHLEPPGVRHGAV
jgi:CheY-like chemotaxis protein